MSEPKNKGGNNTPKKLNSVEKALLGQYETRRETPDIITPGQASNLDFDKMRNRLGSDFQLHRGEQYLVDKFVKEKQQSIYREQKRKAEEQPWYSEAWGFLAQAIGGEIVLGTLEGAGYLLDLTHWGDKAMGGEGDWSNWLSDLMQDGKEWIREKAPIYVDPAAQHRSFWENALYSDGWWAENGVSIASTLSILIPVAGAARVAGMAGKGARLLGTMGKAGKLGKIPKQGLNLVDDIVKKVPKLPTVSKQISEGVGKAIISRQLENHMEAAGVFREQYKRYKAEGMSDADAKSSASKGAAFTYKAGWAMLLTDIPQYIMMARGFAPSKAILSKKLADAAGQSMKKTVALNLGQYATQFALEGFEEAYQFVVAEEGKYLADVDAGMVNPAETSFSDRFDGYLEDAELWTAAFFGGLGGAVFQAAGQPTTEFINKKLLRKSEDYITQNDLRIQEIKNRKKNIAANTKAYYEALEAGDERAANQARTRIGYDVGITSAQAGNWALAKGNLEQLKNATQAEREEYGLGEDLAENIDSLIADAEKAVELYSRNVNKYEASSVGPITYRQFQIHKFSQLLPQRRNEAEQLKQEMPLINELSEAGKTAFERKLQLKSRQRYIQAAKWKLDNVKLPENEKAALEDSIATHEALLEIDKATLKEAVKEELSQTERVTLNALDGRNAEELSKAEAEIMWMEHYLGQYSEDLVHLTDDNTQREIKKTEEEEAAKIAKGHKNKVNEEKDKRSRDKLNGALSPEEQEAMAQVAGYSEETTVAELSDRIDADPSLWEALDDDAKREIEKYRATKAKVNEDPNYTEAEIEAEGGLTLDSLTRRNAVTDYKKQAANSVEHIEAETPANVDTEENIRRGDDLSTRRVTTLDTPLAWKSSSQVPGTAREADALSTPENVALTNFLESGNSLQGVDVVFSVDQEWLDANPKHKHFSIINRELQAGRVPANIGWVPIKATLHRNGKPLEYGGEVLSMNLHLTKHFINPETNQPYTEHGLSQQTTLERHKTAIVEAALNGNTLKSKVLGKTGGNLNVVRDDNGEFARFSVEETLGNPEDIELVYSNTGMYVDHAGNTHPELLSVIPGDNGAIYAKTETANGTAFPLRLHVDKLSSSEANLIHALYTQVLTDSSKYTQPISDNIRQRIEDSQDPRVSGLASYLDLKTISHKDLLAHLVYEGKKTEHSGMGALYTYPANKKTGAQATLVFGTNKYSVNNILDGKGKTVVLEHLTRNRRRQVDVKMLNNPAYKKYLMDNMILTSNAKKTASNTLFVQPTVSYEDNLVPTNPVTTTSEVTVPTAPKNTENAGVEIKNKAGKITKESTSNNLEQQKADVQRRRQEELDANSRNITVKKEEIVVNNGLEDITTILSYKKDGSVTYRSFDSKGTELAAGRLKPGYTQEKFNAAIGARYMERKAGDEKSILVEKPIKSRKNLEFKTNKEAKINAKYDAELAALEQDIINQQKQGSKKADIEARRQEELDANAGSIEIKREEVSFIHPDRGEQSFQLQYLANGDIKYKNLETGDKGIHKSGSSRTLEQVLLATDKSGNPLPLKTVSKPHPTNKADKINAKYDAELAALKESQEGDVSTKEGKQEIINPSQVNPSEITQRNKEVEARLKKEGVDNLFIGANLPTGSNEKALPVTIDAVNDITVVTYANEKTGLIDTVISGFSENNFVGYYRIYENGKPTNKWSSKFENQNTGNKNIDSKKKDNFKTMISSVQERLPSDHLYTEKTSISTDGLRVWANQIDRGTYEFALDEKGFYITNRVSINGDALVNELGVDVKQGDFQNIKVRNEKEFNKVKEALLPYLEKLRLNENNIYWTKPTGPLSISGSTVQIDLPVLKPVQKEVKTNLSQKTNTELEVDPISEQFALDISSLMPDPDMKEVAPENQEQVQEFKADEAAEAKAKRREARRKIAQENRRKGNTGAFKIFDGLPNSTNIKEIRDAAQHIRSLLPSEIGIELVPDYVQVLSQGKVAVGLFKNGMVTLSERAPKSVAYHEAFHAVFRTMLTVEQRQSLIAEGKKNFEKPRESELEAIMERHDVSLEEATNIFYEEVLADEFGDYMTNPEFAELNYGYSKGIKGLFQRLMNWVNAVFRNKYTTKKLFRDINVGKYRTKTPLISREVRFKAHADFTAAEVREITQQLAYAAFSKVTSLEDVRNYDPNIVINSLLDAQDLAIESNTAVGDEIADRIDLILEENENTLRPFWVNKLQEFVRVNFELKEVNKIDKEQDQDNGDLNQKEKENWLKSSYEVSGKVSATASVKFLVGMIPKVEGFVEGKAVYKKSSLLGLPEFNDFGSTYNLIEKTLSGVVSVKEGGVQQDALKLMKDKLIEQSKYMPEFKLLVDRLNNMSEDVQTSFHFTFSRQRNNYLDHLFVGDTPNMQSRISAADIESKENAILNTWATQFEKNFGYYNSQGLLAYNPEAISAFKVAREEFAVSLTENRLEGGITQNTINQLGKALNLLGVQMSDKGFNKLIDSYPSPPTVDPGTKLLNAVSMLKIDLFNATNDLLKKGNMQMTSETNHLLNEKTFFKKKSATAEADFIKHGGENSFIGAEGNRYYGYQDNSATSTIVAEIQAGDLSHLEMLKKSDYASNSTWLRWLTDPVNGEANRAAFGLSQYGNVKKLDSQDSGDKASNLKPSDQFIDVFNKYLQGHFVGLAEADKGQQTYFEGLPLIEANMAYAPAARQIIFNSASPQAVDILRGYLADELLRMETARRAFYGYIDNETGERHDPLPEKDQLLYYHYHINKNGERVPGNAFESSLFPDIKLEEFGLRDSETGAIPTLTADNFENNDKLNKYLKDHFLRAVNKDVNKAVEAGLISKTPEGFENIAIGVDILEDRGGVNSSTIANAIATYTLNSIVANVEQTKLFNGDPALYKTKVFEKDGVTKKEWAQVNMFSDFMKRIPAAFASGKAFRIFNEEDGTPAVRSHYSSATIENIDGVTSAFFGDGKGNFNTENLAIISKNTGVTQEELKKLFKPYLKVNQTDAQAWITLKTYRERMRGLGKWSEAHDEAYVKAQSEETLTIDEVKLLAQPLKTVHAELMSTDGNVVSMQYNKQSEAVLLPFMTKGTQLDKLRKAMENNGVDHVIVLDGKKVGAKGITSITDSEGNILDANELTLNKVPLSYTRLFLQQDLKAKGVKDTLLGSQLTKVALSVVDLEATYFGGEITGAELVQAFHDTISELSDIGLKEFKREIGYTEELGVDPETLNNLLQREFLGDVSDNILEALEANMDLDALPIKNKIQNKINAILTKKAVRMEQQGGAFIQMSNFGFVGAEVDLTKAVKDNIIWFKDPKEELQPMSMEENGKVKPAQILLPYNVLLAKLKENGIDYQNMSPAEIQNFIDPELLKGISYRIPNQGPSSNDVFEIVGILPPQAGDTMIAYSSITTKTGSDFDIDKAFVVLPHFYFDGKQLRKTKGKSKRGLQNYRLDLMEEMLTHTSAYPAVMAPLDDPWLEDAAKKWYPEEAGNAALDFFRGTTQLENKATFDGAKNLVGVIANHMTHQGLVLSKGLYFNDYYLGKGKKVADNIYNNLDAIEELENKESTPEIKQEIANLKSDIGGITRKDIKKQSLINGNDSSLSNILDEDGNSIATTLGGFMNAIVDAAKDPFIVRANINQVTAGTAFMLARAGVSREWIVAFMGQPILKEYVKQIGLNEGRFTQDEYNPQTGEKITPMHRVLNKYKITTDPKELYWTENSLQEEANSDITTTTEELVSVLNMVNDKTSNRYGPQERDFQKKVLSQFLIWQQKAKALTEVINVSKVDVNGATANLTRALLAENLLHKVVKEEQIGNLDKLLGYTRVNDDIVFNTKENTSMIGTYHKNSVRAIREIFKGKFMSSTEAAEESLRNIMAQSGYVYMTPKNEKEADKIVNELYAAAATETDAFYMEPQELKELLYGTPGKVELGEAVPRRFSLSERISRAKRGPLEGNLLIQALQTKPTHGTVPGKVYLPQNETTKMVKDDLYLAWEELFDPKAGDPKLAEDLMKYAFYTTGFSTGIGAFYEHIPMGKLREFGFSDQMKTKKLAYSSEVMLQGKEDLVYKNLYQDNALVPVVPNKLPIAIKTADTGVEFDTRDAFVLTENNGKDFIAGLDINGQVVFKPFVKRSRPIKNQMGEIIRTEHDLYQLQGYTDFGSGVYVKTNKLGINSKGNVIKEYNTDGKTSIFPENNVTLPPEILPYLNELPSRTIPVQEYKENEVDKMAQEFDTTLRDRLNFCFNN